MENIKVQLQTTFELTWFQTRCRNLLMGQLNKLTGACLTIREDSNQEVFGDPDASLNADIRVNDARAYTSMVTGGSIGAAEAFVEGWWTTSNLTHVIQVFARFQDVLDSVESGMNLFNKIGNWWQHRTNRNSATQAKKNIMAHYDLGNELYKRFLDKEMVYSSAVYANQSQSLEEAQLNKFDLICQRLELQEGENLLEIGTGWGGLAIYAAKNYGVNVTTTTISDQQHAYVQARLEKEGLTEKVTLLKQDYRLLEGQYDKLVSVEMIEAVGKEYFATFFRKCNSLVKSGGKLLLQAITIADQRFDYYANNVDFIQKYIFPGGCLPSVTVMAQQLTKHTNFVTESLFDIGLDYAKTLEEWRVRFEQKWPELQKLGYDQKFKRLWLFYLCYCEGAFLEKRTSTVHLVARK